MRDLVIFYAHCSLTRLVQLLLYIFFFLNFNYLARARIFFFFLLIIYVREDNIAFCL